MTRSIWLSCDTCGHQLEDRTTAVECPECQGLLSLQHGEPASRGVALRREVAHPHPSGVWRFRQLVLPTVSPEEIVSHPEGNTPLIHRAALDRWCDLDDVMFKHEGHNPTGSFKDRGMTVGMTQAKRIGARAVACASTGNTSASLASYAAHAELPALVFMPEGQVALGKLTQSLAYGARTLIVAGDFDECLRLVQDAGRELGLYLLNSINPFRVEGQKTIVFEMLQQLDWDPPDWIVVPAGNLGNTAAFGKALREAMDWGLITRMPRIAAVQAEGAAPFAAAFGRGFDHLDPVRADTIATAIRIGAPASYSRGVRAIRESNGVVISVSDDEILAAKAAIDAAGVGCEPASAASLAGIRQLRARGTIGPGERVVVVLTGHILKDPGILQRMHEERANPPAWANPPVRIPATLAAVERVLAQL